MFRKRLVRRLAVVFLLILILLVGVMAAAAATADRFYVSRIIAWREADFHDYQRFSSRTVQAGPNEFSFEPPPEKTPEFLRKVSYRSGDRKSTRLNSSHANISYAVFCLKKKIVDLASTLLHELN